MIEEELIGYVMARANGCCADDFSIGEIQVWIREFFVMYRKRQDKLIREMMISSRVCLTEDFYSKEHICCGCPNCGECECKRCKKECS